MLNYLDEQSNKTLTENGAAAYASTFSDCLDLFATIGAVRHATDGEIIDRFIRAFAEDRDAAMKILFFARDVRGGLGERRVFRVIAKWLADNEPASLRKNIALFSEYGRYDDLVALVGTVCEDDAIDIIRDQLRKDVETQSDVSLLAKWLPSVNASNAETVRLGKHIAKRLGMTDAQYRKVLSELRKKIRIIENNLRERDYTFDYSKQPSRAMFKYRNAFLRNDHERYCEFLRRVESGEAQLHTDALMPYDIISPCLDGYYGAANLSAEEREAMNATWNALRDFGSDENAIAVVDGSGSMYRCCAPSPIGVALSLGIYFAEHNKGAFRDHFITFSETPRLIKIKGEDIAEKVRYCASYDEVANTNIQAVFELILNTALKNSVPQEELPQKIYIISDMEFDCCTDDADITNFDYAKELFEKNGYKLPDVVFWNVASRHRHQPVTMNEVGVALVSGCTPRLFSMVAGGLASPYTAMMEIIGSKRYAPVSA